VNADLFVAFLTDLGQHFPVGEFMMGILGIDQADKGIDSHGQKIPERLVFDATI